jgi:tetratricopeptide (TPR) repeat protein
MARARRIELGESFAERVERLADELRLAIHWNRPSILLAVYQSHFIMLDAQTALENHLALLSQRVERFNVDERENADILLRLSQHPYLESTVFFVQGLSFGGQATLRALNIRREYFVEHRIRAVFWLTEQEAIAVARDAPDFWAFRHRAVDFMEPPVPERAAEIGQAVAWIDFEDRNLRQDTDAKIALRLALLQDLPPDDRTLAAQADLQYTLAALYRAKGEFADAIRYGQEAIHAAQQLRDTRRLSWCYNLLGNVYRGLGRTEEAIATYQRAIQLDPNYAYPHNGLGTVYADLGRTGEAMAAFQQAIQLDSKYATPHNGLGNVYRDLGRFEEAIAAHQRAIQLDSKYATPHNGLGNVYADLGRTEEAIAAYQRAIQLDPKFAYPHNGLGTVYADLGHTEEAIAAYQRAIQLDPNYASPHNGLGITYHHLGRYDEAIGEYEKAIALDPQNADIHYNQGNAYQAKGDLEKAIEKYRRAIELKPEEPDVYSSLGYIYLRRNEPEEAEVEFNQAIRLAPKDYIPVLNLGLARALQGRADEARALWRQGLALCQGNDVSTKLNRALFTVVAGEAEDGLRQMRQILEEDKPPLGLLRDVLEDVQLLAQSPQKIEGIDQVVALLSAGVGQRQ